MSRGFRKNPSRYQSPKIRLLPITSIQLFSPNVAFRRETYYLENTYGCLDFYENPEHRWLFIYFGGVQTIGRAILPCVWTPIL